MSSQYGKLKEVIKIETREKWNLIKNYSFKAVCNSLIKLIEQAQINYKNNNLDKAYISYMVIINIFSDNLKKISDFNQYLPEYKILSSELNQSIDIVKEIDNKLKEREREATSGIITRSGAINQESSPPYEELKTISCEKLYKYIERLVSGRDAKPPQILVIDIRSRKKYESGHINWAINPYLKYNGVVNIPLDLFYGLDINLNKIIEAAVHYENDIRKKELINNIYQSDLIVYYDDNTKTVNNQIHYIISNGLFHNSNGMNIKRSPVMLEEGYNGWIQFIQRNGNNISEWTESFTSNDYITRGINNMNLGIGNQNINKVNKSKISGYTNNDLTNSYYMQYAQYGQYTGNSNIPVNISHSQQPIAMPTPVGGYNSTIPSTDYYSNINMKLNAPSESSNNKTSYYPVMKPEVPEKPFTLKYHLQSSNQNSTTAISSNYPYHQQQQQVQPKPLLTSNNYLQNNPPPGSYSSSSSSIDPNVSKTPPRIPKRQPNQSYNSPSRQGLSSSSNSPSHLNSNSASHLEIPERIVSNRLSSSISYESLNTTISLPTPQRKFHYSKPPIPARPGREFSINEIHKTKNGSVGLKNLGNTCYMNSILQCLNATSPLTRFFLTGKFKNDINRENDLGTHGELANEYYRFLKTVWYEHQPTISPTNIKSAISHFNEEFVGTDQHDSQEFLSCILDGLHEDLNLARRDKTKTDIEHIRKIHSQQEKEEEENQNFKIEDLKERAWKRYIEFNNSIIVSIFQGQYMSILECSKCGKISPSFNSLMYLSVPIPKNAKTLNDCLDKYVEMEYLKGSDGWNCPNCKRKVDAKKKLLLSKLPNIMLIQLKRFYYQGPFRDKINKYIDFPIKNLDLSKYTYKFNNGESCYTYNLFAISNHYGTLSAGHYTAFIKNKFNDKWIEFNDSRYSDISESKIKTEAAYILFYVKTDKQSDFNK